MEAAIIYDCGASRCELAAGPRVTDAGMDFIRCPTCGTLRIPQENLIHHTVLADPVGELSVVMRILFAMRMWWLRRLVPKLQLESVRIADVGCGDGQFLQYLLQKGVRNAFGIEPDEPRAANARRRSIPVFSSKEAAEAAGHFKDGVDIMFVWQVLEHVDRPAEFLRTYAAWLAPGGQLLISVPNQKSIQTRLFGFYSAYPDYGRHIWYHDKSYLAWLRVNVPSVSCSILPDRNFEYEIFSWVDSLSSFMVRDQNFVHGALKKGHGGAAQRLFAAALACIILPFAALLSILSIAFGAGSTLTFLLVHE